MRNPEAVLPQGLNTESLTEEPMANRHSQRQTSSEPPRVTKDGFRLFKTSLIPDRQPIKRDDMNKVFEQGYRKERHGPLTPYDSGDDYMLWIATRVSPPTESMDVARVLGVADLSVRGGAGGCEKAGDHVGAKMQKYSIATGASRSLPTGSTHTASNIL